MCVTRKSAKCIQYTLWCMKNYRIETHIANSEWNKYTEIEQLTISSYDKTLAVHEFNSIELNCNIRFPPCSQSLQWAPFIFFFFSATLIFFHANTDYLWFICMFQPLIESFHANYYFFLVFSFLPVLVMLFFFYFSTNGAMCILCDDRKSYERSISIHSTEWIFSTEFRWILFSTASSISYSF